MTLRLIYSRPMAGTIEGDAPEGIAQPTRLGRFVRKLLEALHRSRVRSAAREIRRHRHLVHIDDDTAA